ncbi:MAG: hypothetical protein IJ074_05890 [Clostridia bacterium]|nr:hypothetical protein [Clostridia bacterium]
MRHFSKTHVVALVLLLALTAALLSGCAGGSKGASAEPQTLSFADAVSLDKIKKMNGQTVQIIGYMATLSPVSGKYVYLMNMPYQSCPFCVPNTTQLSNTMAVYAPEGKTFDYTDQAVRFTGTMKLGDYSDEYGYQYNYRIVDATYETVDLSEVSERYGLWQSIASDGIVGDINSMLDFEHFVSQWTEYQSGYTDPDTGEDVTFMLYAGDVQNFLENDGPAGYASYMADDYFPGLIRRVRAISDTELEDLVGIIETAQGNVQHALQELDDGNYVYDEPNDKFILNNNDELYNAWYDNYIQFSEWLGTWEV